MQKINVAILGATGAVGQELLAILEERNFPLAHLTLLASEKSAGKKVCFKGEELIIQPAHAGSFKNIDLVLSSAGSAVSKELVHHAVKAGALVIDNTSAFRMDPKVPLVIPEINPADIAKHNGIIANPNCTTIIMLVPLWPLHKKAPIRRIVAATYQAVSGAGARGLEELDLQTKAILAGKEPRREVFPYQIAFNLFSHNSEIKENGSCEEEIKVMVETKKILHQESIRVAITTVRVPIHRAHSEALFVEFEKPLSVEEARCLLADAPGIRMIDDREKNYFPMPLEASGKDDILVGRLRKDETVEHGLALFVSGDQIRKGAALNAIQIAEVWLQDR